MEHDPVNHPSHYTQFPGIEVIQLTEHLSFCRGNAVKYIARAGAKKAASEVEDLEKAVWYIQREIDRIKRLSPSTNDTPSPGKSKPKRPKTFLADRGPSPYGEDTRG